MLNFVTLFAAIVTKQRFMTEMSYTLVKSLQNRKRKFSVGEIRITCGKKLFINV